MEKEFAPDKPHRKFEVTITVWEKQCYSGTYRLKAYSKAHAIYILLDYIQKHADLGWNDFEFTAVREIGGRR